MSQSTEQNTDNATNDKVDKEANNSANTSDGRLIVAPCNDLEFKAPIRWLKLAWKDIKRAPKVSLTWGLSLLLLV